MPRRTVSVKHVYVHDRGKPKQRKDVSNFDGEGSDLLALMRGFINSLDKDDLVDKEHERYLATIGLSPVGRSLLVEMEAGWYGARGRVRNVATHDLEHEHDASSATTNDVRFLVTAPKNSPGMLVFVEQMGRSNAGSHILSMFYAAWRAKWNDEKLMMKVETLVETEAWLKEANLREVSGVVAGYDWSSDIADAGKQKVLGKLHTTLLPDGPQEFLPRFIWERLRDDNLSASRILGLPEDAIVEDIRVKVSANGKDKTFAIDRERQPALSYLLSDRGMPDDAAFRKFCFALAKELYPAVGGEWKTVLESGVWPDDMLNVTLEMQHEQ